MTASPTDMLPNLNADYKRACFLAANGAAGEAKVLFRRIIQQKPDCWEAYFHLGCAVFGEGAFEEAEANFRQAVMHNPAYYSARVNLGMACARLNRHSDAIDAYLAAIALEPGSYPAHFNLANTYSEMGRRTDAMSALNRAIEIDPDAADAIFNLSNLLVLSGRIEEAIAGYQRAITLKPELPNCHGKLAHAKMLVCDWSDLDELRSTIFQDVERGNAACTPFVALSLTDSVRLQRLASGAWARRNCPATPSAPPVRKRDPSAPIRLGYFSMDYRDHPVSTLMAGVIEAHDRARFEVFAFSYGRQAGGAMRQRMEGAFDHFLDVKDKSNWEIAQMARELGIDIAIDLAGYTTNARPGIMALRPSPVQVSFLGFVGPQGVDYIDYLIADPVVVPDHCRDLYSEKIVYLPWFQPNDGSRVISDRVFAKEDFGLSSEDFVFCCFNNSYKFSPETFSAWMEILRACPSGRMLILAGNPVAEANLRREAAARGVDPERLVFTGRVAPADYLARFRAADLFLDTLPYNSGTTASDALWAGLPVLTCAGEAYASRMAASLLSAIGMPELITATLPEYVERAIDLANNPEQLGQLRSRLSQSHTIKGLYDARAFTKSLEAAFVEMWERSAASLPPDHISTFADQSTR